jgi:hypothetical protein
MNLDLRSLQDDCKTYSNPKRVYDRLNNFTPELRKIVNDPNGQDVLETGVALFAYLADVIRKKGEDGISIWNAIKLGYPGHAHTDLIAPYFDVCRTQLLWYNAIDKLQASSIIKAEIVFNIYFRWYIASMELMRKMLVFADYCRRVVTDDFGDFKFNFNVFGGGDASGALRTRGVPSRGEAACRFYEMALRHALAHGNVMIALPSLVAIRQSRIEPGKGATGFEQTGYRVGPSSTSQDVEKIVADFQRYADPCYQAIRVFFFLYSWMEAKHVKIFKPHWPEDIEDGGVLRAIVDATNSDPEGLLYW